ncbi:Kinase-like protein [Mycena sanguinolenta]|uniref:Kinase-like protein n=1 Tax=Mycena sanguinolenta TaxID=230812 RepID=A0A8H6X634_9AGAR|nr:Kinase-like protein [Mycena sanguinolenta]
MANIDLSPLLRLGPAPVPPQLPTTLPGGTSLCKGFYDLLSMIPTPSPSRLIWGAPGTEEPGLAGPSGTSILAIQSPYSPEDSANQQRHSFTSHRIYADEFKSRWDPDGMDKLGGPRWANPIKDRVRQVNQAKAVNEVASALKPSPGSNPYDGWNGGPLPRSKWP